ncbi:MAG: flagellar biosynthesis anti-sigma factor FlgM [Bacillaceae bacterium]|nr:flagellar biosynthesis anti-sigma factor FlgM [Bacillaceae bacterium]
MKINGPGRVPGPNPYQQTARYEKEAVRKQQKKDEVQISPEAKSMLQSEEAQPVSREQRIQQLKEQVQSGTYHVSSEKIAEKLIQYWRNQL